MKVETQEKTEIQEKEERIGLFKTRKSVTVTNSTQFFGSFEFDTMVVSEERYAKLMRESLVKGLALKFNLQASQYLPDRLMVLRLNEKMVATILTEE